MRQILVELPALHSAIACLVIAGVLQWRKNANASLFWTLAAVLFLYFAVWKRFDLSAKMPVYSYGVMLALGAVSGIFLGARRPHVADLTRDEVFDFGLCLVLWGVIGARVFHVVFYQSKFFFGSWGGFLHIFAVWEGGLVWYGAVVAGIAYLSWFVFVKKKTGWRGFKRLGDLMVPSSMLGLAFGRMGCFLNGCCWGKVVKGLPWAVTFPGPSESLPGGSLAYRHHRNLELLNDLLRKGLIDNGEKMALIKGTAARSLPVHPTELYSLLGALLVWGILELTLRKRKFDCMTGFTFLIVYPIVRFTIEFFRADNPPYLGLTFSQWTGILSFCAGVFFFARGWLRARRAQT